MQGTKKQSFFVIVIVVIVLGIASLVGVMVSRPPSATIGNASSHTTPRIVREDLSLAHNYKSLKELRTDSTLIVQGTVNTQAVSTADHGTVYTISTIRVEHAFMSKSVAPQTVLVRQQGGVAPDGTQWIVDDFPLLKIGSRYILYLTPSPYGAEFYPVGAPQGVFVVNANTSVSSFTPVGVQVKDVPLNTFAQEI